MYVFDERSCGVCFRKLLPHHTTCNIMINKLLTYILSKAYILESSHISALHVISEMREGGVERESNSSHIPPQTHSQVEFHYGPHQSRKTKGAGPRVLATGNIGLLTTDRVTTRLALQPSKAASAFTVSGIGTENIQKNC